jgi:hypothetical protein
MAEEKPRKVISLAEMEPHKKRGLRLRTKTGTGGLHWLEGKLRQSESVMIAGHCES